MRASGCLRGAPLVLWERGILARLPGCLNQPIVAAAPERRGCALLMHDVGRCWLGARHRRADPAGPAHTVPGALAVLHAAFWAAGRSSTSSRRCTATWSSRRGWRRRRPPRCSLRTWCRGWSPRAGRCSSRSPRPRPRSSPRWPATRVRCSRRWPRRRRRSCTATSSSTTSAPTTRGARCCSTGSQTERGARRCSDLAWYLAINCRRLPQSKEASIAAYREALELRHRHGPWWDRQLALCLLGALVLFGWEKALGGYDEELAWWETKSLAAAALLS